MTDESNNGDVIPTTRCRVSVIFFHDRWSSWSYLAINIQVSILKVVDTLEFSRQNSTARLPQFHLIPPFVFEPFWHCHRRMWITQLLIFKYLQSFFSSSLFCLNILLKTLCMIYHYLVSGKYHVNGGFPVDDNAISLSFVLISLFRCDWDFLHWNFVSF